MRELSCRHWRNSTRAAQWTALLLLLASACSSAGDRAPVKTSEAPTPAAQALATANPASLPQALVAPGQLGPTCDSASALVHDALGFTPTRLDGVRAASFRILRTTRVEPTGCRISGEGSFAALHGEGPVDRLLNLGPKHGWRMDNRVAADGPDGSTAAMRRRDVLCVITGSWEGHDDSVPDTVPPKAQEDQSFEIVVECARDVPSNLDVEIPDSIWAIARAAGIENEYMISPTVSPVSHMADFDGDGVRDAAVVVEHRATGKLGIAVIRRGPKQMTILGAGTRSAGPDDLNGLQEWSVFDRGVTMDMTIGYRPAATLVADALWVRREKAGAGFYYWTGTGFAFEAHEK